AVNRNFHFAQDREAVAQAERNAFQNGADHVGASVRGRETDKRGARIGIAMGCAFTHQVGRPKEAVGAGWRAGGFLAESLVRIAPIFIGCARGGTEAIAEPSQREASSLGHAHHMPSAGNGMAEGMNSPLGIERRPVGSCKYAPGSSDGAARGARTN